MLFLYSRCFRAPTLIFFVLVLSLIVVISNMMTGTTALALDKSKPPIGVIIKDKKYEIRPLPSTDTIYKSLIRLQEAHKRGNPTKEAVTVAYSQDHWIECYETLCQCVGEIDCAEMLSEYCNMPPGSVCGYLSGGEWGCSCLKRADVEPGEKDPIIYGWPFALEFIWP